MFTSECEGIHMPAVIGKLHAGELVPMKDAESGAHIVRLTARKHVCHHIYPTMRATTGDGKFLLYFREVNGRRQLHAMNLDTGISLQLTAGKDVDDYHAAFSSDDRHVYYLQNNVLWRLDVRDLLRTHVYNPEPGWMMREFSFSDDERYLVSLETISSADIDTLSGLRDWSTFALGSLLAPRCRLVYVDIESGNRRVLVDEDCWLGRPSIRPGDGNTVMYCHEGPYNMIDTRMWLVQSDGSDKRPCRNQDKDTVLTWEFWFPDGRQLGFLCWNVRDDKPEELHAINPDTMEERILCTCPPFVHCSCSPDGRYIVGDTAGSTKPVHLISAEDAASAADDYIYLCDLHTGEQRRICHHGSSFLPKYGTVLDSEPHPVFARDGRSIIYVSDCGGIPSIYQVDLARFLWEIEAREDESYAYGLASTFGGKL